MKQEGNINEQDLDKEKKRQVVDEVDAELILLDPHRAQGIDRQMQHQKSPDGEDPRQGMEFQQQVVEFVRGGISHENYRNSVFRGGEKLWGSIRRV